MIRFIINAGVCITAAFFLMAVFVAWLVLAYFALTSYGKYVGWFIFSVPFSYFGMKIGDYIFPMEK